MGQPQTPAMHDCPVGQTFPQRPQLVRSVAVATQRPLHTVCAVGHWHTPATHDCPVAQTFPHAPQLAALVARFTQTEPQRVWPAGQPQRPLAHTCVAGHMVPVPHAGPPGHTLGMVIPHGTAEGAVVGHRGAHSHMFVVALHC